MLIKILKEFENPEVTLTAYLHESIEEFSNAKQRPAVLVIPGGGYMMCSDREGEPIALSYVAEGYHAFVLKYTTRDKKPFPQPLIEAEQALELIHAKAGEWGVDTSRIYAAGFSAGGHLAAALGTMGKIKPTALILGYPCILESMKDIIGDVPGLEDKVTADTPPAFIFATCEDALVPVENSLEFALSMKKAGVPFEIHIFQNGGHGLSLGKDHVSNGLSMLVNKEFSGWFSMSMDWLRKNFGDFQSTQEWTEP